MKPIHDIPVEAKTKQRSMFLDALKKGLVSTLEALGHMGILHRHKRVYELHKCGYGLMTQLIIIFEAQGRHRRVGVNALDITGEVTA